MGRICKNHNWDVLLNVNTKNETNIYNVKVSEIGKPNPYSNSKNKC